ncbi:MAG TPA: hypothetical protein VF132_13095 [Rudaea sp.]
MSCLRDRIRKVTAAFAVTFIAFAATAAAESSAGSTPLIDQSAAQKTLAAQQAQTAAARSSASTGLVAAPGEPRPAEYYANKLRAYPPSCVNSPLPLGFWAADPHAMQANIRLPGDPNSSDANERAYTEVVKITVFRLVCTSGLSATLVEFDRPNINTNLYPVIPGITVTQGNVSNYAVRMADDPNTFFTTTYALSPLFASDVFMLENYYNPNDPNAVVFNFNQAFKLTVDNLIPNDPNRFTIYPMLAYTPPANPAPLPINGYLSSAYYDPNHSGEGMEIQIYDNGDHSTRTFFAAWYTFDPLGLPFWLTAQGTFPIATSNGALVNALTNVPAFYVTNGGFAGNFGAKATSNSWGTMSFSFPDCNHVTFSYNGNTGTTQGPSGSGTKTWQRLANVNNLVCQ